MRLIKTVVMAAIGIGIAGQAAAQKIKTFSVTSPDGATVFSMATGEQIVWSVQHKGKTIIAPSPMALTLNTGELLGSHAKVIRSNTRQVNAAFENSIYKKRTVPNQYNELQLDCKGDYGILVRVYNEGVAYRFFLTRKNPVIIQNEAAVFNVAADDSCWVPLVRDLRGSEQFISSFEALYDHLPIRDIPKDTLAFLPVLYSCGPTTKAAILEAEVIDYPGMFLERSPAGSGFKGVFAPYPLSTYQGGFNRLNTMVSKRAPYIATVQGNRSLPWRAVVISDRDKDLLNNDLVQQLSDPVKIKDVSWIKPGKVAWDWWNDWNISKVNFKAGINTQTYQYYIDFAAANHLEYIIMDEGWSDDFDLLKINDRVDVKALIQYAKQKNVGIILWASWYAVQANLKEVMATYAAMGIKGFKIDFMDRDDQVMVQSLYTIAEEAANHHLLIDYHGMYKPTGLQRTWPNVVNFEGVKGLENSKWTPADDVPQYDATIPFIRMLAGPMDYTPGAMRNATKEAFRPSNSLPMSQGTRCHQLAMYVVFEAPLQMLADNPTIYQKEQECTDFICKIPTVFDATVALDGKVGAYAAIARKKGNSWYVGALGNWNEQTIQFNYSFLGAGQFEVQVFKDGLNADRDATDYATEKFTVTAKDQQVIYLSKGGGWAAIITPLP